MDTDIAIKGRTIGLRKALYRGNDRLALRYVDTAEGSPYAQLTVNIPGADLKEGEFVVKTWEDNEELARLALQSGIFEDTGRRVQEGFVPAQIWRFKDPDALLHVLRY